MRTDSLLDFIRVIRVIRVIRGPSAVVEFSNWNRGMRAPGPQVIQFNIVWLIQSVARGYYNNKD